MADRGNGSGRSRGLSRARSQGQSEHQRRPGQMPEGPPRHPPPQQQATPQAARVSRGAMRNEASTSRPGGSNGSLAADVQGITLSRGNSRSDSGATGRQGWRGRQRDPRTRPAHVTDKRGNFGTATTLVANYFRINTTSSWAIYHYHVDFLPAIENVRQKRSLMHVHHEILGVYNFDGGSLYKVERFDDDEKELVSHCRSTRENVVLRIKLVREVTPDDPIVLQILDIQMRRNMRTLGFQQMNRLYYDQHAAQAIPNHNLELWPGFATAVHQYEESAMMCADLCFKILRSDTVLDQLRAFLQRVGPAQYQAQAQRELVGCIILTRYNNSTYRIDDIAWDRKPTDTFTKGDQQTSFVQYYQSHWNIAIRDHQQPLLISMPRRRDIRIGRVDPILLIPELSTMTGISEETRSNFHVMKNIAQHTRVNPEQRAAQLRNFMSRISGNAEVVSQMSGWGLAFDRDLLNCPGRVYPPEKIHQTGDSYSYDPQSADWTIQMRGKRLLRPINLEKYLLLAPSNCMAQANNFIDTLIHIGRPMGININQPQRVELPHDRANDYHSALVQYIQPNIQMAICIVPNNRKDRYDAIKKTCCIERPVASQVIVSKTISRQNMLMSVATKIGIQLNCKLGGAAWAVEIPIKNVMVIGYDSYHDSSERGKSVGAICSSFNNTLTQYYSKVNFQTSNTEMVAGLRANIIAAIRNYHQTNNMMPDRIIVYRDGVGEGQLGLVKEHELEEIKSCFKDIGTDFSPRLTFIVVNKRITTRLFLRTGSSLTNPTPGTVVDSTITRPEFYDFFIVSQSVRQGTVTPTMYNIIHDESGMRPDHLQRLTYKLTHLYYNWPGTIRVPAPCLYAHKMAFLTGQSLHMPPSDALAKTLYFL